MDERDEPRLARWRRVSARLAKYVAVGLALHVGVTILQLPAALRHVASVGQDICDGFSQNGELNFANHPEFYRAVLRPASLQHALQELAPLLAESCFSISSPTGSLGTNFFGAIDLKIGSVAHSKGITLEVQYHLFWHPLVNYFNESYDRLELIVVDYRKWEMHRKPTAIDTSVDGPSLLLQGERRGIR